jgi:asparagine synthase (glutamine-hydrolysing)
VLLAAIEQWNLAGALERFVGMFAFALWDRADHELCLVRDRVGKKPLHYRLTQHDLHFGSELRALSVLEDLELAPDPQAVGQFLRYGYIAAPRSIFAGVAKVEPGCIVRIRASSASRLTATVSRYWSAGETFMHGRVARRSVSFEGAAKELEELLTDAVRVRLESDVPLGAFLSGGIDSSVVVALMQRLAGTPVRTFSIGFGDAPYDEAVHARAVAAQLGTAHTELYVEPRDMIEAAPQMATVFDEPFADSSQIPTWLVARLARRDVKVVLSGDGGDEVFGGYSRYQRMIQWQRWVRRIPGPLRPQAAAILGRAARLPLGSAGAWLERVMPGDLGSVTPQQRLAKAASLLQCPGLDAAYERHLAHWEHPEALVQGARAPWWTLPGAGPAQDADDATSFERMCELDLAHYLPDDILVKVDRTTMNVGLEARAPLLDHRVIEFAAHCPVAYRVTAGDGKRLLKHVAFQLVPRTLLERPKQGFAVPLAAWLRGPLREWASELLARDNLRAAALLDPDPVWERWDAHVSGRRDWSALLWDVLMLQAWHREFRATRAALRVAA